MQSAKGGKSMTTAGDVAEQDVLDELEPYPAWADDDEQRRAFILECIGVAAAELDAQSLGQMVIDLVEMLKTGTSPPPKVKRLRPVT
jgi:hypothetical protein